MSVVNGDVSEGKSGTRYGPSDSIYVKQGTVLLPLWLVAGAGGFISSLRSYKSVHMLRLTLIPQESSSLPLEFISFDRAAFGFSSPNAGISWRFSSHSSSSNENGATISSGHCIAIHFAVY